MEPTPVAPQAAPDPLAQPAVPPSPADTAVQARAEAPDNNETLFAGGVAALLLALGGGIYAATRRRRRVDEREEAYEAMPARAYVPPAAASHEPARSLEPAAPLPAFVTVEDVAGKTVVHDRDTARSMGSEELIPAAAPAQSQAFTGVVPLDRAERDTLLDQMISAPPSAENPFTSRKARLRRARIILQSREIDQNDAKKAETSPFDWRTYKPSTSNPAPATPPRVTA